MCHEASSLPAILGPARNPATEQALTLVASDGARSRAFLARPDVSSGVGVVVLPDNRGLHPFYERLALALAEQGYPALALDWYGRTAGAGPRDAEFPIMEHLLQVRRETIDADIAAAADRLRESEDCPTIVTLGFCFGGRQSFLAMARGTTIAAAIGFYGAPGVYPNGALGPTQRAAELRGPILAFFGGADEGIPPAEVAAFDAALTAASVEHDITTYPGAAHGFFDLALEAFATASTDAWRQSLAFIARLKPPAPG